MPSSSVDNIAALGLIGIGILWRHIGLLPPPEILRRWMSGAVFFVLLPALTFRSMLNAPMGSLLWKIPLAAAASISGTILCAIVVSRQQTLSPSQRAAFILTAGWGNVTYLGIPMLTAMVGSQATFVAVLTDFAAATPLLWTLGIALIMVHKSHQSFAPGGMWQRFLIPPLWAAGAGIAAQRAELSLPALLDRAFAYSASAVVPLMMFVLGLSLRWEYLRRWRELLPVAILKLLISPLFALVAIGALDLSGIVAHAVLLEAAMPTMMLTLVVAERYRLDTEYVAAAIAVTTMLSIGTIPLWWLIGSMLA